MAKKKVKKVKVTLRRSVICSLPKQRKTVKALGLRKIGSSVIIEANESMMGMVNVISHLVSVEEVK